MHDQEQPFVIDHFVRPVGSMPLELDVCEPNCHPRTVTVVSAQTVIGRSANADLRLESDVVSSRHAALKIYKNGCAIEDLGSSNGTFVNGHRITVPVECPNGTTMQFGEGGPTIEIRSGSSAAAEPARSSSSSNWALWLTGGLGVALLGMMLLCGVGGAAAAYLGLIPGVDWLVSPRGDRNDAVALIVCGWKITTTTGATSEEPYVRVFLGVDGISPQNSEYVAKYVEKKDIRKAAYEGKEIYFESLLGDSGTGFPITRDGFILTNKHVVEDAVNLQRASDKLAAVCKMNDYSDGVPTIWAFVDREPYPTKVVHVSETYDLAILKSSNPTPKFFALSTAVEIERGIEVSAVGFPGVVRDLNKNITVLLGRDVNKLGASGTAKGFLSESDLVYYQTFGQINSQSKIGSVQVMLHGAKINHGNSGGPLVDPRGTVLAINTWGHDVGDVNASQILSQMREEIDSHVPGVRWVR